MIDKCESVFFLNTPNSIVVSESIESTEYTYSPWIYSEIEFTKIIRRKDLHEYRENIVKESVLIHSATRMDEKKRLTIRYVAPLDHLVDLNVDNLAEWKKYCKGENSAQKNMDTLYSLMGFNNENGEYYGMD
jgi:hypothetical protein